MVLFEVHQRNNKGDPNENHDDEESQQQRKKSEQEETETLLVVDQDNNNDNTKNNNNNTSNKTITIDVTTLTNMIVAAIEESKKNKKEKKGENKDGGDKYDEDGNIIADPGKASPKDHMANERTFFKWVRMLFFIFIFGLYILAEEQPSWRYIGLALMAIATCFLPYALYRYWMRQGMMIRKEKGGADKVGIYIFAGIFFIFMIVMLANTVTTGTAPGKKDLSQDLNQAAVLDATSF
mmetsp:Transcript_20733/g.22197  ORF Transcript_20733/g.22197 Transcript_20733/m.22197 type:complete len:237 (+) Transcript_20733:151-861(+)